MCIRDRFNSYSRFANEAMEQFAAIYGVELRSPYDSKAIIEFSLAVPPSQKKRSDLNRDMHRATMANLLPDEIIKREDKANFTSIFGQDIKALLADQSWQNQLVEAGWVDRQGLSKVLGRFIQQTQKPSDQHIIWSLYVIAALINCWQHIMRIRHKERFIYR